VVGGGVVGRRAGAIASATVVGGGGGVVEGGGAVVVVDVVVMLVVDVLVLVLVLVEVDVFDTVVVAGAADESAPLHPTGANKTTTATATAIVRRRASLHMTEHPTVVGAYGEPAPPARSLHQGETACPHKRRA
jgi:hypothetical protein